MIVTHTAQSECNFHVLKSAMTIRSTSQLLGEKIVSKFDSSRIIVRDLGANPVPIIDQVRESRFTRTGGKPISWVFSHGQNLVMLPKNSGTEQKLALSDTLTKEIMDADVIILSVSIDPPGSFKAWIDQVMNHSTMEFVKYTKPNDAVSRSGRPFWYSSMVKTP
jgi:FMN-dependent NADH-azoreductase